MAPNVMLRIVLEEPQLPVNVVDSSKKVVATCTHSCVLKLARGDYVLRAREGENEFTQYELTLDRPINVTLTPASTSLAILGIAIGILGAVGAAASLPLLLPTPQQDNQSDAKPDFSGIALVSAACGASVGGWLLFARNRRALFSETEARQPTPVAYRVRPVVATLPGGALLSTTISF